MFFKKNENRWILDKADHLLSTCGKYITVDEYLSGMCQTKEYKDGVISIQLTSGRGKFTPTLCIYTLYKTRIPGAKTSGFPEFPHIGTDITAQKLVFECKDFNSASRSKIEEVTHKISGSWENHLANI